jgi:NAD(P)-dependent dehydrogenase (short-subunit alcohol dehydrogenase family)
VSAHRRVLVTGGSRGIGRAVAEHLARQGWRVVVAARHYSTVDEVVASLAGDEHIALALDVADERAWDEAMEEVDGSGGLDGLVAAAGVLGPIGSIGESGPGQFRETIAVNLIGTALALHHAVPRLARRGGRAVTFSGGGGTSPLPRYDAYAASKAAVARLTENVAAAGAAVNCVAPGFIATDIHKETLAAGPRAAGSDYYQRTRRELEEGGADLGEVCDLVAFLLSDDARAIRGKLISAQWDPWRDEGFRRRLGAEANLATLRRIDDREYRAS